MVEPPKSNIRRFSRTPRILTVDSPEAREAAKPECSFCGKGLGQVGYLLEGTTAKICNGCLRSFAALVDEQRGLE